MLPAAAAALTEFDPTPQVEVTSQGPGNGKKAAPKKPLAAKPAKKRPPMEVAMVSLSIELDPNEAPTGYVGRGLDFMIPTTAQRVVLGTLTRTLIAREAKLLDGTSVNKAERAVLWLLERLAQGLPTAVLDELLTRGH